MCRCTSLDIESPLCAHTEDVPLLEKSAAVAALSLSLLLFLLLLLLLLLLLPPINCCRSVCRPAVTSPPSAFQGGRRSGQERRIGLITYLTQKTAKGPSRSAGNLIQSVISGGHWQVDPLLPTGSALACSFCTLKARVSSSGGGGGEGGGGCCAVVTVGGTVIAGTVEHCS